MGTPRGRGKTRARDVALGSLPYIVGRAADPTWWVTHAGTSKHPPEGGRSRHVPGQASTLPTLPSPRRSGRGLQPLTGGSQGKLRPPHYLHYLSFFLSFLCCANQSASKLTIHARDTVSHSIFPKEIKMGNGGPAPPPGPSRPKAGPKGPGGGAKARTTGWAYARPGPGRARPQRGDPHSRPPPPSRLRCVTCGGRGGTKF